MTLRILPAGPALPSVLVIAPTNRYLVLALGALLSDKVRVRWGFDVPSRVDSSIGAVVIDLTGQRPPDWTQRISALTRRADAWLLLGDNEIPSAYLALAQCRRIRLLHLPTDQGPKQDRVVAAALVNWFYPSDQRDIGEAIVDREPSLGPVRGLVSIICNDPWRIRLPRDLAVATHSSLRAVRSLSRSVGFRRVEHLITAVRLLMYEEASCKGASSGEARRIAGIVDLSNWKRQVSRVRRQLSST